MTDATSVAADQLRSIVERILRLKEDQDTIGEDIKEIYKEAGSGGFDKTVIGQIVAMKRKEAKDPSKFQEKSAILELYLDALNSATPSHTRASERASA